MEELRQKGVEHIGVAEAHLCTSRQRHVWMQPGKSIFPTGVAATG
jgi:hypothetical protein